jgi:hypothetical protein
LRRQGAEIVFKQHLGIADSDLDCTDPHLVHAMPSLWRESTCDR